MTNRETALDLAAKGIRVFPCAPSKVPMVKDWENAATSAQWQIEANWDHAALPAIPTSGNGLVVIDCDRKTAGVDGVANFTALCAEHGIDLTSAFVVETPNGPGL